MSEQQPVTHLDWNELKCRQIAEFPAKCRERDGEPNICPKVNGEAVYMAVCAIMEQNTMDQAVLAARERAKTWGEKCLSSAECGYDYSQPYGVNEIVVYVDNDENGLPVFHLEEESDGK